MSQMDLIAYLFSNLYYLVIIGIVVFIIIKVAESTNKPITPPLTKSLNNLNFSSDTGKKEILSRIIIDLEEEIRIKNLPSSDSLSLLLEKYKSEYSALVSSAYPETSTIDQKTLYEAGKRETLSSSTSGHKKQDIPPKTIEQLWNNWYEENSINLLLYIGAFLIVSAAVIFVAVGWEALTGPFKLALLVALTLSFFLAGIYFYNKEEKYKNAGITFLGIGALLVPFNGLALQHFVVSPILGYTDPGLVWLLTSIVSILIYLELAIFLNSKFYAYIICLGSLSLVESFVHIGNFNGDYYVLGSIFTSIALLLGRILSVKYKQKEEVFSYPFLVSSNILLPLSLGWGLVLAMIQNNLFTNDAAISLLLGGVFYAISYTFERKGVYYASAITLISSSILIFSKAVNLTNDQIIYIANILALANALSFNIKPIRNYFNKEERDVTVFFAAFINLCVSAAAIYFSNAASLLVVVITFALLYFALKSKEFFVLALVFFTTLAAVFTRSQNINTSASLYIVDSTGFIDIIIAAFFYLNKTNYEETLLASFLGTILGIVVSIISFSLSIPIEFSIFIITMVGIKSFISTYLSKRIEFIPITLSAITICSYLLFTQVWLKNEPIYYFLWFTLPVSIIYYIIAKETSITKKITSQIFISFSAIHFVISILIALGHDGLSMLVGLCISIVAVLAAFNFKLKEFITISNIFLFYTLWMMLRTVNAPLDIYPIFFFAFSFFMLFAKDFNIDKRFQEIYETTALIAAPSFAILFGLLSYTTNTCTDSYLCSYNTLEFLAIMSAFGSTFMYYYAGERNKRRDYKYTASAIGIISLLWLIHYLRITEIQAYAIPLGLYFLGLGILKSYLQDPLEEVQNWEIIGLLIITVTSLVQAFSSSNSWTYSLLLGIESTLIIFSGISIKNKLFIYWGSVGLFLAVLSQTYTYIQQIPQWIIVGIGGLIFISIDIYLISKKEEKP